jgi:hypothetical protein
MVRIKCPSLTENKNNRRRWTVYSNGIQTTEDKVTRGCYTIDECQVVIDLGGRRFGILPFWEQSIWIMVANLRLAVQSSRASEPSQTEYDAT